MTSKPKKPTREKPPASTARSRFTILMEAMEQQNRATIEAVFSTRDELRREFNEKFDRMDLRMTAIEFAVRHHTTVLEQHGEQLSALRRDVGVLQRDVGVLQRDVGVLQRDVVALQHEVRHLSDVVEGKVDKARFDRLEERVTALESRLGE